MIEELAVLSTDRPNWVPAKHGVSKYYSPATIVTGKLLEYEKHCKYEFGTYIQDHTQNNLMNVMEERAIDCVYLHRNENDQGGHILLNLNTGKKITHGRITALPLPMVVREKVEKMADEQGIN